MPAEEAVDTSESPIDRALIIAGGTISTDPFPEPGVIVIAADSGYDHAVALGLEVDVVIGDMDSITPDGLAAAKAGTPDVIEVEPDKDETDLELAIGHAVGRGATSIDIHGGEAGSLGHLLGVALELTDARWREVEIRWHTAGGIAQCVTSHRRVAIVGSPGDVVSLVPVGDVDGVTTSGLKWALNDEPLPSGTTRGLRNELTNGGAAVSVRAGTLLAIWEGASP